MEKLTYNVESLDRLPVDLSLTLTWAQASGDLLEALIFTEIYREVFIFDNTSRRWLIKTALNYYEPDMMDESLTAVDSIAQIYLLAAGEIDRAINSGKAFLCGNYSLPQMQSLKKRLQAQAGRLRSEKGRRSCLRRARGTLCGFNCLTR